MEQKHFTLVLRKVQTQTFMRTTTKWNVLVKIFFLFGAFRGETRADAAAQSAHAPARSESARSRSAARRNLARPWRRGFSLLVGPSHVPLLAPSVARRR